MINRNGIAFCEWLDFRSPSGCCHIWQVLVALKLTDFSGSSDCPHRNYHVSSITENWSDSGFITNLSLNGQTIC